ncbi:MAG TPA: glycoside hydrolase family 76 protein [Solirubrobacteraceae bacterium]
MRSVLTSRRGHIRRGRARALLAAVAGALALTGAGATPGLAVGSVGRGHGAGASLYPAGAEYPRKLAHPYEFAHGSSNTGGIIAGGGAPTKAGARRKKKPKLGLRGDPARALVAYAAMQQNFYIPGTGLYIGEPYSYLWPFSQALVATVSVSGIRGQAAKQAVIYARELHVRMYGLARYWSPAATASEPLPGEQPEGEGGTEGSESPETVGVAPPGLPSYDGNVLPPGGVSYYDDNEWVGIELARLYAHRHEAPLLEKAEQVMGFVMAGWQTNPKLACPGGVPFSNSPSNTDRNTITNGPAAELGVQLYKLTGNQTYLQFAQVAYEWVRHCLLQPNGLYADHIRQHGVVDQTFWSYTQGAMIGAGTLLYQATGNSAYLNQARETANAAQSYFTIGRLLSENPFFPSVYFRNLMYLDALTHDPPGARLAQSYVNYAWVNRRLKSGLFVFGSPPSSQLLVQAAVVQIYALLSTPASTYF